MLFPEHLLGFQFQLIQDYNVYNNNISINKAISPMYDLKGPKIGIESIIKESKEIKNPDTQKVL